MLSADSRVWSNRDSQPGSALAAARPIFG